MSKIAIKVFQLAHGNTLPLPAYATQDSAGMDLMAALDQDICLKPGERAMVPTGLTMALPSGYEGQIRPRSGLAAKHGITVLNTPGTLDADYRGEIKIVLINLGHEDFVISHGMRIAQLVVAPVTATELCLQHEPLNDETERSTGGFGSSGLYGKAR